jgi:hypothetical protein
MGVGRDPAVDGVLNVGDRGSQDSSAENADRPSEQA